MRAYLVILRLPGALAFCAAGLLARAGGAMMGLGTVLMIRALYGEYGLAGAVSAANTIGWALGSAVIARLVDRYGQRRIMLPAMSISAVTLTSLVVAAALHAPGWLLVIPAAVSGLTGGSIGPLVRARWSLILTDPRHLHTAFSLESALDESTFIVGPVLATALATGITPTAGLIAPIILSMAGALLFFSQRATEPPIAGRSRPVADAGRSGPPVAKPPAVRPALFMRGMPPIALACLALGWLFGACDLTVAAQAEAWGAKQSTGLILAAFSVASMLSGLAYGARAWATPLWKRFVIASFAALLGLSLLLAQTPLALAACGFLTGLGISPTLINASALIQRIVPTDRLTEGLTWMSTAIGVGISIGSTLSGQAVDHFGPHSGFIIVAALGAVLVVVALASAPTLRRATESTDRRR